MDTDRLLRIFGRMMDSHGPIFIGSIAAIFALLLLVFVLRRIRSANARPKPAKVAAPIAMEMEADETANDDADIDLPMMESEMESDMTMDDAAIVADMQRDQAAMTSAAMGDELDSALAHSFDSQADELEDLDDITIPKLGEAPPPKQSRFFASSWLGKKDKSDAPTISLDMTPTKAGQTGMNDAAHKSAAECARLGDIERKLMALRELYEAGLIAPEVYVVKAREFAAQV